MVKKVFLSTLTERLFDNKKEAQECEDTFVKMHELDVKEFAKLQRKEINKRWYKLVKKLK